MLVPSSYQASPKHGHPSQKHWHPQWWFQDVFMMSCVFLSVLAFLTCIREFVEQVMDCDNIHSPRSAGRLRVSSSVYGWVPGGMLHTHPGEAGLVPNEGWHQASRSTWLVPRLPYHPVCRLPTVKRKLRYLAQGKNYLMSELISVFNSINCIFFWKLLVFISVNATCFLKGNI